MKISPKLRKMAVERRNKCTRFLVVADRSPNWGASYFAPVRGMTEGRKLCKKWVSRFPWGRASITDRKGFSESWHERLDFGWLPMRQHPNMKDKPFSAGDAFAVGLLVFLPTVFLLWIAASFWK